MTILSPVAERLNRTPVSFNSSSIITPRLFFRDGGGFAPSDCDAGGERKIFARKVIERLQIEYRALSRENCSTHIADRQAVNQSSPGLGS